MLPTRLRCCRTTHRHFSGTTHTNNIIETFEDWQSPATVARGRTFSQRAQLQGQKQTQNTRRSHSVQTTASAGCIWQRAH